MPALNFLNPFLYHSVFNQKMIQFLSSLQGVEFWAVNTDAQALEKHDALNKLQIGTALTRGLGKCKDHLNRSDQNSSCLLFF